MSQSEALTILLFVDAMVALRWHVAEVYSILEEIDDQVLDRHDLCYT